MRLHERDKARGELLNSLEEKVRDMKRDIERKMAQPYGDGSTSNMVNATTDVIPRLEDLIKDLADRP
tara:strand:- start:8073 stop:8273 length:201 start_codon:yes stop_codon:yes gene_type:complete